MTAYTMTAYTVAIVLMALALACDATSLRHAAHEESSFTAATMEDRGSMASLVELLDGAAGKVQAGVAAATQADAVAKAKAGEQAAEKAKTAAAEAVGKVSKDQRNTAKKNAALFGQLSQSLKAAGRDTVRERTQRVAREKVALERSVNATAEAEEQAKQAEDAARLAAIKANAAAAKWEAEKCTNVTDVVRKEVAKKNITTVCEDLRFNCSIFHPPPPPNASSASPLPSVLLQYDAEFEDPPASSSGSGSSADAADPRANLVHACATLGQPYFKAYCSLRGPQFMVGDVITQENCLSSAVVLVGSDRFGRSKVTAKRPTLVVGSWMHVPVGCSVQSGGDWAAYWNKCWGRESCRDKKAAYTPVTTKNHTNEFTTAMVVAMGMCPGPQSAEAKAVMGNTTLAKVKEEEEKTKSER